jgi:Cyclin, N-terminal domain
MASREQFPLLGIRMKHSVSNPSLTESFDETCEALAVLRSQETAYRCRDYFGRRQRLDELSIRSKEDHVFANPDGTIDPGCREKMCEWSYRVCDCGQLPCSREMVAVAFSYLDRFLDRCLCDRATFKLAAVTSFYVATKILSSAQISIRSLVELSRGEFNSYDIREMEMALLKKLAWRMNPPTIQAFIRQLRMLFPPTVNFELTEAIYQRAIFFAELCVYDHSFISKERYLVAVACLLNAMEILDDTLYGREKESLWTLGASFCVDLDRKVLERAQARLWYLYSCSAQVPDSNILPLAYSEKHILRIHSQRKKTSEGHSPVSVRLHGCD